MTIDKLPSRYIGLYVEQLEQGGLRVPFSSFFLVVIKHFGVHVSQLVPIGVSRVILFEIRCLSLDVRLTVSLFRVFYKLCKQGHWFSFENKTERGTRRCFKEVTTSLKGWKRNFFLIDHRAIPDAMPWRHGDTDLRNDFPSNFNQDDVERLSEFLVPLRPPPRHFLYVCGLTTACRHPGLSYSIKDQDKNVISMDTFLKLPTWTGTIVSKGDPIPEDQRPKP
nr:transposase (putative), gypsy type [Tanacetum cinerariifolium]